MDVNLDAFARQLTDLVGRFADLGAKLGEAARELQDGGAPPADALVEALAAGRLEFVELRAEIVLAAETLDVAVPDAVESAKSLEPVLSALATALGAQRRRAALEEARGRMVAVLDRVDGLRHQDDDEFGPLVTVKMKAEEVKSTVLALTDATAEQLQALVASVQPFADLLTMLEATGTVDDERFSSLEESVAHAFGRQITVALARGRLLLPGQAPRAPRPEPVTRTPEPEPATPEPVRLADAMRPPDPIRAPEPEPIVSSPPRESMRTLEEKLERMPAPKYEPPPAPVRPPEPVVAAAPPPAAAAPAASLGQSSSADETAQWWLAAWARWSGWKNTLAFPEAVREELSKYPYLLSVPIQQSPDYEEGLLAYGYSIILEHVEKQNPGCIGNALNNLKPSETGPVGTQLYHYLVTEGQLTETYPDFIKKVLLAGVPEPGPWVQARIIHSKDDTRVFQRPTPRLGETEQTAQRFLADNQRFREHKFSGTLAPMTTRFFLIQAELKDAHGVEAMLTVDGAPSDAGLVVTVPAAGKASKKDARRLSAEGTPLPGLGRDYAAIWFAVFNADAVRGTDFELALNLRKDTRGMRK
jgi:hypothetical protein